MVSDECRKYYDFVIEIIHEAGQIINDGYYGPKKVESKGNLAYNLVTDTDKKVEQFLVEKIKHQYPEHLIIGEEGSSNDQTLTLTDTHTWIIDPLDGTINFIKEIPIIAISVALAIKKEVVLGVIFNPIMNQFYSAIKGGGAYFNGKQITSSKNEDLHKSIIGNELSLASIPFLRERTLVRVNQLAEFGVFGFRCFGSAALSLCYVADGNLDVYFTDGLQCWDVAAGILILQEAGGLACGPDGSNFDMFSRVLLTAGNKVLLTKMVEILTESDKKTQESVTKLMPEQLKSKTNFSWKKLWSFAAHLFQTMNVNY